MSSALSNWPALQEALKRLDETECWALLQEEKKGKRRLQFLLRIYGRANRLRCERERRDITRGL
jgi:hypothetical protein